MDARLLTLDEFHKVLFFRLITLAIMLAMLGLALVQMLKTSRGDAALVTVIMIGMAWRFAVEWRWLNKSAPAFIHGDELVLTGPAARQIALTSVRSVTSRHSVFLTRRYRSFSEHLAFVQFTLNSGERVFTLAQSAVFESPAASQSLAALQTAVLDAKTRSLTAHAR